MAIAKTFREAPMDDDRREKTIHTHSVNLLRGAVGLLVFLALLSVQAGGAPIRKDSPQARVQAALSKLPLYFIENHGQVEEPVAYYVQGQNTALYFTSAGVTFVLSHSPSPHPGLLPRGEREVVQPVTLRSEPHANEEPQRWVLKLDFVRANPQVVPRGQDLTSAIISYCKGPQAQWQTGLPTYRGVVYPELWPGIDLVYSGTGTRLKYTFVVKPGADPKQIKLAYRGATGVTLTDSGQLQVSTPVSGFTDDTPYAYQETDGQRAEVAAAYELETNTATDAQVYGFRVGSYDPSKELILDPTVVILAYAGYLGGSDDDKGRGIAVDSTGNAYVTGSTSSTETSFPVTVGPDLTYNGGTTDAFVAKVKADGTGLVYAGYIGGAGDEVGNSIAVDSTGNAYVTGSTTSPETSFPVTVGPSLLSNGGFPSSASDAFVAKVKADGTGLVYAGYIGGAGDDVGNGIAVDSAGNAYVTGSTGSSEALFFPVTTGPDLTYNGGFVDAFVAKVKADGTGFVYAGYIGGAGDEAGNDIAVDSAGNAYVIGSTSSSAATFPVAVGPGLTLQVCPFPTIFCHVTRDAFVAKVKANGTGLVYAGYIGGTNVDDGRGIAVDSNGNAYVTGSIVSGPLIPSAFVYKVKADGTGFVYTNSIAGADGVEGNGIAVDSVGNAYVTGSTRSSEARSFPVTMGPDLTHNGEMDAFVAKLKADGTGLVYAGYIGGAGFDVGNGIAVDSTSDAYVVGWTNSNEATFPVTVGPDLTYNGGPPIGGGMTASDAFVAKVVMTDTPLVASILPVSRSVQVGNVATAFASIINGGTTTALGCSISPVTVLPATFAFQTTNCANNQLTGSLNTPVNLPPGGLGCFIFAFTPSSPITPTDVVLSFDCTNTAPAPVYPGINTFLFSASTTPTPDIIASGLPCKSDDFPLSAVNLPGPTGTNAVGFATTNVGAAGVITVVADTGSVTLPLTLTLCQTNPATGACINPTTPGASVTLGMVAGAQPTFSVFAKGQGTIPIDLVKNRIFLRFRDNTNTMRGATSVAVRTHSPACVP